MTLPIAIVDCSAPWPPWSSRFFHGSVAEAPVRHVARSVPVARGDRS